MWLQNSPFRLTYRLERGGAVPSGRLPWRWLFHAVVICGVVTGIIAEGEMVGTIFEHRYKTNLVAVFGSMARSAHKNIVVFNPAPHKYPGLPGAHIIYSFARYVCHRPFDRLARPNEVGAFVNPRIIWKVETYRYISWKAFAIALREGVSSRGEAGVFPLNVNAHDKEVRTGEEVTINCTDRYVGSELSLRSLLSMGEYRVTLRNGVFRRFGASAGSDSGPCCGEQGQEQSNCTSETSPECLLGPIGAPLGLPHRAPLYAKIGLIGALWMITGIGINVGPCRSAKKLGRGWGWFAVGLLSYGLAFAGTVFGT
ncbi:MAG: hypothetical protein JWO83_355 [Caulobacteraceae bacterium]|nr:hypothetical protein [Caulobacteraceae bacterium]